MAGDREDRIGAQGKGTLYIVGTPLGNLQDLSPRAAEVLRRADLIAAEDTRRVTKLLAHLGFDKPTTSFHSYSSTAKLGHLMERIERGDSIAMVSDAGMPCLSDPGAELVAAAWDAGARVVPVPGPCAAVTALAVSGLPAGRFLFAGYPPRARGERRRFLGRLVSHPWPTVLYEAPGRVAGLLEDLVLVAGADRFVVIGRELTKLHEEVLRGPAGEIAKQWDAARARGEVTVVVGPGGEEPSKGVPDPKAVAEWLAREGLALGRVAAALVQLCGLDRRRAYELARAASQSLGGRP